MATKIINEVDAYIQAAPELALPHLKAIRQLIQSTVPKAEEYVSYGIPSYKLNGPLIGFGAFKDHISLFMLNGSFLSNPPFDLSKYPQTKSAIHFSYKDKLPSALIKKIIKARLVENIAKEKIKAEKKAKK
ncbi:MAG: DUF1801 domain-containing protein [Chitinophagales bacterium]|jgi:uncharacterized protein YdhG (YjbR/CyaY superfamily)|nr:DUF1801 domain-containing protein [Bacteroidota bacterium]MBP8250213.1 DUF1801 domain-containing protein [Chitinophagales bacterium]MBP9879563.1 DUF1801 domain-containing protein [Chitinophagales bacterium]